MAVEFKDWQQELRKREFNMRVKVHRKRVSYGDTAYSENGSTADIVLLEMYEGTEMDLFMSAYYAGATPVKNGEGYLCSKIELPAFFAHPFNMPSLVRLNWPNELFQKPHLMVMTVALEHLINTYKDIEAFDLKIFPEEMADKLNLYQGQVRI